MKLNKFHPLRTWYINRFAQNITNDGGKVICCGKAIVDIANNAEVHLCSDLVLGANLREGSNAESYLKMKPNSRLNVNGRFQVFFGASLEVFDDGELTLGKGYINTGGAITCARSITLGDGVFVARNTYITDSDHHCIMDDKGTVLNEPQPVVIGDHVLIGFGAVILKGVTIGDGAVIAAGSVVTSDIPAGCMAAGVPAKVVKEGVIWK